MLYYSYNNAKKSILISINKKEEKDLSNYFDSIIDARVKYLTNIVSHKQKAALSAPKGSLRINIKNGRPYFYHVEDTKDTNGYYLNKNDILLARALAQKDYDLKVLRSAEKELGILERVIKFQGQSVEEIYNSLSPVRRALVEPVRLPDDEYIRQWLKSKECEPMGFSENDPVILTSEGYRVRSKSEQLWADTFERFGVPHVFEPLVYLEGHGWVRPDFGALNVRSRKEIYVEHFGIMDSASYFEDNVKKLHDYERNGFVLGDNLLITMETRRSPLEVRSIEALIKKHFL